MQMALNALPGYCIRGENGGVLELLARATAALQDAKKDDSRQETDPTHPWFGIEQVDTNKFGKIAADLFRSEILCPQPGSRVSGFKEIRYAWLGDEEFYNFLDFAKIQFSPRFVFLTRDPKEASKSGMWANERKARRQLEKAKSRIVDASARYDGFLLDHSEFATNPDGIVPLIKWLGEDPAPAVASLSTRLTHMQSMRKKHLLTKISGRAKRVFSGE